MTFLLPLGRSILKFGRMLGRCSLGAFCFVDGKAAGLERDPMTNPHKGVPI